MIFFNKVALHQCEVANFTLSNRSIAKDGKFHLRVQALVRPFEP